MSRLDESMKSNGAMFRACIRDGYKDAIADAYSIVSDMRPIPNEIRVLIERLEENLRKARL